MTRRILMIFLILLMLCGISVHAEDSKNEQLSNALYRIVLRTEKGDETLGSGVLFANDTLILTAAGCCAEGNLYAIGADGEYKIVGWEKAADTGIAIMGLESASASEPLLLANYDTRAIPCIFGVNAQGEAVSMPLSKVRQGWYHDQSALIISSQEGILPGAFLSDQTGQVMGIVVAQQMEGIGTYIVLDPKVIYEALTREESSGIFLKAEMTCQNGIMNISWQDEERTSGNYLITLSAGENKYYTYYEAEKNQRSIQLAVPSGHIYYVQVQWVESPDKSYDPVWENMTGCQVGIEPCTEYAFTQKCWLASTSAEQIGENKLNEMPLISVDTLTDRGSVRYLQICNTYDVSVKKALPMTVELIAPDGQFYYDAINYTLDPAYEKDDCFVIPVDDLFTTCAQFSGGTIQPGEYTLRCMLAGKLTSEYVFTVQPAGTPLPAEMAKTSGFITGLTVEGKNGLVTLKWDTAGIPENAKIGVFYVYEGNSYYSCQPLEAGTESASVFAVPDRLIRMWAVWSLEEKIPSILPQTQEQSVVWQPPQTAYMTDHKFQNLRLSVVPSLDPDAAEKGKYLREIKLTRQLIKAKDVYFYFQTEDTYEVEVTSEDHPLAIILVTPDGMCFVAQGYYIFDKKLQTSDLWLRDITKLFETYQGFMQDSLCPAGEYRVLYCIDGQIAGEYTFVLK